MVHKCAAAILEAIHSLDEVLHSIITESRGEYSFVFQENTGLLSHWQRQQQVAWQGCHSTRLARYWRHSLPQRGVVRSSLVPMAVRSLMIRIMRIGSRFLPLRERCATRRWLHKASVGRFWVISSSWDLLHRKSIVPVGGCWQGP